MQSGSELFGVPKKGKELVSLALIKKPSGHGSTYVRTYSVIDTIVGSDIKYVSNTTDGDYFVISTPGMYSVTAVDQGSSGAQQLGVSKNDQVYGWNTGIMATSISNYTGIYTSLNYGYTESPSATFICISTVVDCKAGDQIRIKTNSNPNYTGDNAYVRIIKLS